MRPVGLLLATWVWIAIGCSAAAQPYDSLLDEIERAVRLPAGARPLDQYARYYARGQNGEILGLYLIPASPRSPGEQCVEVTENLSTQPVSCPPELTEHISAGQRLWLDDYRQLPGVEDGGCSVVNVRFNASAHRVEAVFCNGVA